MNTRKPFVGSVWALASALLLLVSTAALANEDTARPAAPELHPAPAAALFGDQKSATPTPAAKKSKKKAAKKPTSTSEGLELAPAPLMKQKP